MIVLALLEINEQAACDLACQAAAAGVPYGRRVRMLTECVLQERPDVVQVRWARLARQDAEEHERRTAARGERETMPTR